MDYNGRGKQTVGQWFVLSWILVMLFYWMLYLGIDRRMDFFRLLLWLCFIGQRGVRDGRMKLVVCEGGLWRKLLWVMKRLWMKVDVLSLIVRMLASCCCRSTEEWCCSICGGSCYSSYVVSY